MKRKMPDARDVVFRPAVEPIEAAALPARPARSLSALHHALTLWKFDDDPRRAHGRKKRPRSP